VTYEGEVVVKADEEGKVANVKGGWEPLLEEGIHLGLVAFLGDPARKKDSTFEIKHQGSGVYVCAACGGRMYASYPYRGAGKRGRMTYICRRAAAPQEPDQRHVARVGEPLDEFVSCSVVERLRTKLERGDEGRLADNDEEDGIDVVMVTARLTALRERLDDMADQRALGEIDRQQLASATATLKPQMDVLQAVLDSQKVKEVETDPVDEITKDGPEGVAPNWAKASPDIRSKVIDKLMTVTVLPTPLGTRVFDDQYVDIEWKLRRSSSAVA
jgi:site-specific DNA recombinase